MSLLPGTAGAVSNVVPDHLVDAGSPFFSEAGDADGNSNDAGNEFRVGGEKHGCPFRRGTGALGHGGETVAPIW